MIMRDTNRMLFVSAVLEYWKKGLNTNEIAVELMCPEHMIERALHEGLEIERRRIRERTES